MKQPQRRHWKVVKRILRYTVGTNTHGFLFTPFLHLHIKGLYNANWGPIWIVISPPLVITFILVQTSYHGHPRSKRLCLAVPGRQNTKVLLLLQLISNGFFLFSKLRLSHPTPIIYSDNQKVIFLIQNLIFHSRTKHFELNLHYICN